jgi:predicted dehydrogenase
LVRFGKKATLNFDISWAANLEEECFIQLIGTRGGVKLLNGQNGNKAVMTEINGLVADVLPQFACEDEWFNRQKRLFLAACRGECPPAATGREGLTVMKVLDGVYESSKQGKEVLL